MAAAGGSGALCTAVVTIVEGRHLPERLAETGYIAASVGGGPRRRTDTAEGVETYWGAQFAFQYHEGTAEARTLRLELCEEDGSLEEGDIGEALAVAEVDLQRQWANHKWIDLVAREPTAGRRGGMLASVSVECVTIPPVMPSGALKATTPALPAAKPRAPPAPSTPGRGPRVQHHDPAEAVAFLDHSVVQSLASQVRSLTPRSDGADSGSLSPIYTARSHVPTSARDEGQKAGPPSLAPQETAAAAALQDVLQGLRHVYSSVPEGDAALRRQIEALMDKAENRAHGAEDAQRHTPPAASGSRAASATPMAAGSPPPMPYSQPEPSRAVPTAVRTPAGRPARDRAVAAKSVSPSRRAAARGQSGTSGVRAPSPAGRIPRDPPGYRNRSAQRRSVSSASADPPRFASRQGSAGSLAGDRDAARSAWRPPPSDTVAVDASLPQTRSTSPRAAKAAQDDRPVCRTVSKPVVRRSGSNAGGGLARPAPAGTSMRTRSTAAPAGASSSYGTTAAERRKMRGASAQPTSRATGRGAVTDNANARIEVSHLHRVANRGAAGRDPPQMSQPSRPLIPLREVRPVDGDDGGVGATSALVRAFGSSSRVDPGASIQSAPGGYGGTAPRPRSAATASRLRNPSPPAGSVAARRLPAPEADAAAGTRGAAAGSALVRTFGAANPSVSLSSVTSTRTAPGGPGCRRVSPQPRFRGARQAAERARAQRDANAPDTSAASIYVPVRDSLQGRAGSFSKRTTSAAEQQSLSRVRAVGKSRREHEALLTGLVNHRPKSIACESELSFEDLEALLKCEGLE
eukprot:TRINITY_DN20182_c4_g1_i1.p1 TRINITY_DN20182_c4_g1~~TRINITY_DN20182_c4_g1_i1.p1  ORF type:complete len:828 (+),score=181.97 TRINITY_DN20182_c4_g1_i1:77-2485(+)